MDRGSALGQIVWHDLFTSDVEASKRFYSELLGFEYIVEHASDFAWHKGAGDYTLIRADGDAHGGIIGAQPGGRSRWLAYVAVTDVDTAAAQAVAEGASMARQPFDVPGVGRSCIVQDAGGAWICPFVASHGFPPPRGVFAGDELLAAEWPTVETTYSAMFGWRASGSGGSGIAFETADGARVAGATLKRFDGSDASEWVPLMRASEPARIVDRAIVLGAADLGEASVLGGGDEAQILADPAGAIFGLLL